MSRTWAKTQVKLQASRNEEKESPAKGVKEVENVYVEVSRMEVPIQEQSSWPWGNQGDSSIM